MKGRGRNKTEKEDKEDKEKETIMPPTALVVSPFISICNNSRFT